MESHQQDKIVKVQKPYERMGRKERSSPTYLRVVGQEERIVTSTVMAPR